MSKKTKEAVDSDKKSIDMMNLNELREIKSLIKAVIIK